MKAEEPKGFAKVLLWLLKFTTEWHCEKNWYMFQLKQSAIIDFSEVVYFIYYKCYIELLLNFICFIIGKKSILQNSKTILEHLLIILYA